MSSSNSTPLPNNHIAANLAPVGNLTPIWAAWRAAYLAGEAGSNLASSSADAGESLFESLVKSDRPDRETLIVWRGETCFSVLNIFPYSSGHVLVMPNRAVQELHHLTTAESDELWRGVKSAVKAIKQAYNPEGINVGLNLGKAAGAGIPGHLHVHCLPRWPGDTNFMTTVSQARVLPEDLADSWVKLSRAWPTKPGEI